MAGTQVRLSIVIGPILMGWNRSESLISPAVGQRVSGIGCLIGFANFHISGVEFSSFDFLIEETH